MSTPGFEGAPVSKALALWLVVATVIVKSIGVEGDIAVDIGTHGERWQWWWRMMAWQMGYATSMETLVGLWAVYGLRVVERVWGSRKMMVSFAYIHTTYIPTLSPIWGLVCPSGGVVGGSDKDG